MMIRFFDWFAAIFYPAVLPGWITTILKGKSNDAVFHQQ